MKELKDILIDYENVICKLKPTEGRELYEEIGFLHSISMAFSESRTITPFLKRLMTDMENTLKQDQTAEKFQGYKSRGIKLVNALIITLGYTIN